MTAVETCEKCWTDYDPLYFRWCPLCGTKRGCEMESPTHEVMEAHYTTFGRIPRREREILKWIQKAENQNAFRTGRLARVVATYTTQGCDDKLRYIIKWEEE